MEEFDAVLGERPNQLERTREDVEVDGRGSCSTSSTPGGEITERGLRSNVAVGLRYLSPGSAASARRPSST